jgi:hypothetical protein
MRPVQFWRRPKQPRRDYTPEATALFTRFAQRHGLVYQMTDAPIEVMWEFPAQDRLAIPIILGLQNCDELNFGVSCFWSYFHPFPLVSTEFETIIDAWVEGRARIAHSGMFNARSLQVLTADKWITVYKTKSLGREKCSHPGKLLQNRRSRDDET